MSTDSDLDYWMARAYRAEKERDHAQTRLRAVQDLLDHADRGHRPVIETWDLRDALGG